MDWNAAIEKHCEALKRILATLIAMAGFASSGQFAFVTGQGVQHRGETDNTTPTLPRHLHRAVLRLLRPAEAAARRLIIALARELLQTPQQARALAISPTFPGNRVGILPQRPHRRPAALTLPLLDPLRHPFQRRHVAATSIPRICVPGFTEPAPITPRLPTSAGDLIDASRLGRRLAALGSVLDDLPRHARRFARWQSSRAPAGAPNKSLRARRLWPLRPGKPPGARRHQRHEIHDLLDITHGLAFWALERPRRDTS